MANGGTFCSMNTLAFSGGGPDQSTLVYGPRRVTNGNNGSSYYPDVVISTMEVPSTGEWYFEWMNKSSTYTGFGIAPLITDDGHAGVRNNSSSDISFYREKGVIMKQTRELFEDDAYQGQFTGTYTTNTVCAMYVNDGTVKLYAEDSLVHTFSITLQATEQYFVTTYNAKQDGNAGVLNFGQDSTFMGFKTSGSANATDANGIGDFYYTPKGNSLALCTNNLPLNEAFDLAQGGHPNQHFRVVTYDGTGSSHQITGIEHQPDLVILKKISGSQIWAWYDSVRGTGKRISMQDQVVEQSEDGVTAFNSDGFTVGATYNDSSSEYLALCWKAGGTAVTNDDGATQSTVSANPTAGFSIVKHTGTGSATTLGHGLTSAPEFIITRPYITGTYHMVTYHKHQQDGANGKNTYMTFASLGGYNSLSTIWNNTAPTASVFSVGSASNTNQSGATHIHYCWHSVPGFSKFGWHSGSNSSSRSTNGGTFCHTGFKPAFVWIKKTNEASTTYGWACFMATKESGAGNYNDTGGQALGNMWWDQSVQRSDNYDFHFLSNGFKFGTENTNLDQDGKEYIWGAWAELPLKYSNAGFAPSQSTEG